MERQTSEDSECSTHLKDAPKVYGMEESPAIPESIVFWHKVLKPLAYWGIGGALVASLVHYVAFGLKKMRR